MNTSESLPDRGRPRMSNDSGQLGIWNGEGTAVGVRGRDRPWGGASGRGLERRGGAGGRGYAVGAELVGGVRKSGRS